MFGEDILIPSLAIIGFFGSIIITVYLFFRTRYQIRMALIEHDKSAEIFREDRSGVTALKQGMVGVLIGVGLVVGYFLEQWGMPGFVAYASMVLLFGGSGLIGYYRLMRDRRLEGER